MNGDKILQAIQRMEGHLNNLSGRVEALTLIFSKMENLPKNQKKELLHQIANIAVPPFTEGNFRGSASATVEKILS